MTTVPLAGRVRDAEHALVLGIGGGGDAVGCLGVATLFDTLGLRTTIGGVAWERFPVDPYPGPRPLADVRGARPLGDFAALVDPEGGATTPEGAHFCESRLAQHTGDATVLIDVTGGAQGAAAGIEAAASELGCDLLFLVDIGGDAIATGEEPGLASPLCDAVMIAAGARITGLGPPVLGVLGAGCDGELEPSEVLGRVAALDEADAGIGAFGIPPEAADRIEAAAEVAVTEASLMVARCARGAIGPTAIRNGRRTVELGPVGALCFLFDLNAAMPELPLARAVAGAPDISAGSDALAALGLRSELEYERGRAREAQASEEIG